MKVEKGEEERHMEGERYGEGYIDGEINRRGEMEKG